MNTVVLVGQQLKSNQHHKQSVDDRKSDNENIPKYAVGQDGTATTKRVAIRSSIQCPETDW